jgi:cysteine peptidase C11 family protein
VAAGLLILLLSPVHAQQKTRAEWLFIYYMPYDNNLSSYGDTIISMISKNITSDKIIATVQADFAGASGMKRYLITSDAVKISDVEGEASANTKTYRNYLDWVAQNIQTKKRAIVFLDHGGKLDEVCMDRYPIYKFLRVDSLRKEVNSFNGLTNHKTDLIYLQVCVKGSIEPLYEMSDCAYYTMASQTELGAPNYYYPAFFRELSEHPEMSARDVAHKIVTAEQPDMYNSLTCIDNSKMKAFRDLFNKFILSLPKNTLYSLTPEYFVRYDNEVYYDLIAFLDSIQTTNKTSLALRKKLIQQIRSDLIFFHRTEPGKVNTFGHYCGVSILPLSAHYSEKQSLYRHLRFFSDFNVHQLQQVLVHR